MKNEWLSQLGDTFTTNEAVSVGSRLEIRRRTIYYALKKLCLSKPPILEKIQHGTYRKISSKNAVAPCTIALSKQESEQITEQSAKVQSADH